MRYGLPNGRLQPFVRIALLRFPELFGKKWSQHANVVFIEPKQPWPRLRSICARGIDPAAGTQTGGSAPACGVVGQIAGRSPSTRHQQGTPRNGLREPSAHPLFGAEGSNENFVPLQNLGPDSPFRSRAAHSSLS